MAKARAVHHANLGAWLFKCSPDVWDLAAFLADGGTEIEGWSVQESYRLDLFAAGQRAFLWAGEGYDGIRSGIVGEGTVSGKFLSDTGSEYWVDAAMARTPRTFAETALVLYGGTRVARDEFLNDPVLSRSEIVRQPFMSNPSFLTKDQLAAVDRLLGEVAT